MMRSRKLLPVFTFAVWCAATSAASVERGHDVGKKQNAFQRASPCETDSDCGRLNDVQCKFDSVDETTKVCQCDNENKTYVHSRKQCALPCKSNECRGGRCGMQIDGKEFCSCGRGYSGDFCEISDCDTICGNTLCYFEQEQEDPYCHCYGNKLGFDYDTKTCRECECGILNSVCEYRNNSRVCRCDQGAYEKDGICQDCDCGEEIRNLRCEIQDGEKKCLCFGDNKLKDGKCAPCDCGWYEIACNFENGKQVCSCRKGYIQDHENECTYCECGDHGKCSLDEHNRKVCTCDEGYANQDGFCKPCKCSGGTKSDFCKYSFFESEVCDCKDGYQQNGAECLECDCGENGRCHFDSWSGQKECHCYSGYKEIDGKCIRN